MDDKKFIISYSGGKDSCLALFKCIADGMRPQGLIVLSKLDYSESWFHNIPNQVFESISDALNIPLSSITIFGFCSGVKLLLLFIILF